MWINMSINSCSFSGQFYNFFQICKSALRSLLSIAYLSKPPAVSLPSMAEVSPLSVPAFLIALPSDQYYTMCNTGPLYLRDVQHSLEIQNNLPE